MRYVSYESPVVAVRDGHSIGPGTRLPSHLYNRAMDNPLITLHTLGQRIWLDNLSRTLLKEGALQRLVTEDALAGVTSNPTIFFKAISESPHYRDELAQLKRDTRLAPEQRYERLAIRDIQDACDLFHPLYVRTDGEDGYVSLEVSPALAYDAASDGRSGPAAQSRSQSREPADQGARDQARAQSDRAADRPGLLGQRDAHVLARPRARRVARLHGRHRAVARPQRRGPAAR